jgi:hypothetical protein
MDLHFLGGQLLMNYLFIFGNVSMLFSSSLKSCFVVFVFEEAATSSLLASSFFFLVVVGECSFGVSTQGLVLATRCCAI